MPLLIRELIIHTDEVSIVRGGTRGTSGGLNGDVLKANGEALTQKETIPFWQTLHRDGEAGQWIQVLDFHSPRQYQCAG